jgi:catalase
MLKKIISALIIVSGACGIAQAKKEKSASPNDLVQDFHSVFGKHHARAIHAKGIILTGKFTPSKNAASITRAAHLQDKPSDVTVRFSNFPGGPGVPDNAAGANPRGMALRFTMADGTKTDIVSHSFNGFPAKNTNEFHELLQALAVSGPNAPKPTKLDQFLKTHPAAQEFLTQQKTPESFATIVYFGVNSFKFINKDGKENFVRYQIIPEGGEELYTQAQADKAGPEYLMSEIKYRVAKKPFRFNYYAQIAEKGDVIDDPSKAWPDTRRRVLLGTIEINKVSGNTPVEDRALAFMPTNIVDGIETADPMISFRSAAYGISVGERNMPDSLTQAPSEDSKKVSAQAGETSENQTR